eukprot:1599224-Prymnesium_polylepis.1
MDWQIVVAHVQRHALSPGQPARERIHVFAAYSKSVREGGDRASNGEGEPETLVGFGVLRRLLPQGKRPEKPLACTPLKIAHCGRRVSCKTHYRLRRQLLVGEAAAQARGRDRRPTCILQALNQASFLGRKPDLGEKTIL